MPYSTVNLLTQARSVVFSESFLERQVHNLRLSQILALINAMGVCILLKTLSFLLRQSLTLQAANMTGQRPEWCCGWVYWPSNCLLLARDSWPGEIQGEIHQDWQWKLHQGSRSEWLRHSEARVGFLYYDQVRDHWERTQFFSNKISYWVRDRWRAPQAWSYGQYSVPHLWLLLLKILHDTSSSRRLLRAISSCNSSAQSVCILKDR